MNLCVQIKVSEDISPAVFDILIKCIYKSTIIIDHHHNHYNTILSYVDNLGILVGGQVGVWSCERHLRTLYESKVFSDLTVVVGDKRFAVHKAILCARSSMFSAMFSGRYKEGFQTEVCGLDILCNSYTMARRDLPAAAQGCGHIYISGKSRLAMVS